MRLGGVERQALVVNAPPPGSLRPAGLVLHGGRGSAQEQRDRTGFDGLALREGFMVVYPEGTPWTRGLHAWNTGYLPPSSICSWPGTAPTPNRTSAATPERLLRQSAALCGGTLAIWTQPD